MKKVIAFFFTVIYSVFTTLAFWQESDSADQFGHDRNEEHFYTTVASDDNSSKAINNDVLAVRPVSKALKHLSANSKRNLLRVSSVVNIFRNVLALSNIDYHQPKLGTATPLLYHSSIYIKNSVFRI